MLSVRNATGTDIDLIRDLSHRIWPDTYGNILSAEQMKYMLEMMYSVSSLSTQMLEHIFIICEEDSIPVGFASYGPTGGQVWKLHKIYLLPAMQGKGAGRFMLNHIVTDIKSQHAEKLLLNVNRYNPAKSFYEKNGFTVIREEDIHIGNGYYMNDYIMQLSLV
ncbi:N-acetyltransferase family protein [Chitinophagaceae bacterium MMS25-I14]